MTSTGILMEGDFDEELPQLAGQASDLTPEAFAALRSELARRRIDAPDPVHNGLGPGANRQRRGAFPGAVAISVAEFLAEALGVYHRQFWLFLRLVAPAVAIGWFAIVIGRNESREIARHIPRGIEALRHPVELTEMAIANIAGLFGSWTAFSLSFAGICVAVQKLAAGCVPSVRECFIPVRDRLGPFLRLSSLLFVLLLILEAAALVFLGFGILWALWRLHVHITGIMIWLVSFACFALGFLVMSRFSLAIPVLILDGSRVAESISRSNRGFLPG